MNYHNILHCNMINGCGLRVVLFVSGCDNKCPGCQNPQTWNRYSGIEFDNQAKKELFEELEQDWCHGITLTGGDPLYKYNIEHIAELIKEIKNKFPNKNIWIYTGYTLEDLIEKAKEDENLKYIIENIDVMADGKYIENLKSPDKFWVRFLKSTNNRLQKISFTK